MWPSSINHNFFLIEHFPDGSAGKESVCNAGDPRLIPGSGRSAGEGIGYPLQYSGLENSMDCIVHGVAKSWTQLSNFHFHFSFRLVIASLPSSKYLLNSWLQSPSAVKNQNMTEQLN